MPKRTTKIEMARLMWTVCLCLTLGRAASAQDVLTVSGVVTTHADGVAVPGAIVTVAGSAATATTDANGRYTLKVPRTAVQRERIELRVAAPGLQPKTTDVLVTGQATTADLALVIDFSTQVTVGSRAAGAEAQKADVHERALVSTTASGADRRALTSTPFQSPRSATSRSCATARLRNTDRTPSPASSTSCSNRASPART